jgi:hypothetical protein
VIGVVVIFGGIVGPGWGSVVVVDDGTVVGGAVGAGSVVLTVGPAEPEHAATTTAIAEVATRSLLR